LNQQTIANLQAEMAEEAAQGSKVENSTESSNATASNSTVQVAAQNSSSNATATSEKHQEEKGISLSSNAMEVIDEIQREESGEGKKAATATSLVTPPQNSTIRNNTAVAPAENLQTQSGAASIIEQAVATAVPTPVSAVQELKASARAKLAGPVKVGNVPMSLVLQKLKANARAKLDASIAKSSESAQPAPSLPVVNQMVAAAQKAAQQPVTLDQPSLVASLAVVKKKPPPLNVFLSAQQKAAQQNSFQAAV
jgi:hypothetical protein